MLIYFKSATAASCSESTYCSCTAFKLVGASSEGEDAKPLPNPLTAITVQQAETVPSYHALFEAYPHEQQTRHTTRSHLYLKPEKPEAVPLDENENLEAENNETASGFSFSSNGT